MYNINAYTRPYKFKINQIFLQNLKCAMYVHTIFCTQIFKLIIYLLSHKYNDMIIHNWLSYPAAGGQKFTSASFSGNKLL